MSSRLPVRWWRLLAEALGVMVLVPVAMAGLMLLSEWLFGIRAGEGARSFFAMVAAAGGVCGAFGLVIARGDAG